MTAVAGDLCVTLLADPAIQLLPWEDLHGCVGVRTRVLWRSGTSLAGLLAFDPAASLPPHEHTDGHHHVYVVEGSCRVGDALMTAGSYAHIPAGARHDIAAVGPDGCQLFYLYLGT